MGEVNQYDLIVVGGGPSGAAAAATGARALPGARILLLERGTYPRHKVCGEFVSAEALDVLRLIAPASVSTLTSDAPRMEKYRLLAHGSCVEGAINPPAFSVTRFDLDSALWDACVDLGVDCRQRVSVESVDGCGLFRVTTSTGVFEASAVANATGRWSNLSSRAEPRSNAAPKWIGLKAHYSESNPPASTDLYFFPLGYCGVQPIAEGRINACAMVRADAAHNMASMLRLHPHLAERSRGWKLLMQPVVTSPLIHGKLVPSQDGVLNVGDAAGFIDPFVGDGITLALQSGNLAGKSLTQFLNGSCTLQAAIGNYSREYEKQLRPVFKRAALLRGLLRMPVAMQAGVLRAIRLPGVANYLAEKTRSRFSRLSEGS